MLTLYLREQLGDTYALVYSYYLELCIRSAWFDIGDLLPLIDERLDDMCGSLLIYNTPRARRGLSDTQLSAIEKSHDGIMEEAKGYSSQVWDLAHTISSLSVGPCANVRIVAFIARDMNAVDYTLHARTQLYLDFANTDYRKTMDSGLPDPFDGKYMTQTSGRFCRTLIVYKPLTTEDLCGGRYREMCAPFFGLHRLRWVIEIL